MIFVMFATAAPERFADLFHLVRNAKVPDGIKILEKLEVFGKPDVVVVFEAPNEELAAKFIEQFGRVSTVTTHLAMKVVK
ncbi:hypothetical protein AciM339_1090 [Aciduliprofundum sp. MAR08-339]|uniref:DUF3303 family protein n=1 Tax=Aciduliprofundum sp. (strain MAR08-339) TaxID=673860 RepID=UPI0002A4ADA9|nr:hypothetical protein AciM339_1090 [Aciduliprofundum sp. MAR08-339]